MPKALEREVVRRLTALARLVAEQTSRDNGLAGRTPTPGGLTTERIAEAVADGEIVPWYQPIVDLRTERPVGLESLARWRRSSGEVGSPDTFIPIAEQTDLIVTLDRSVMSQALRDLAHWQVARPDLRISVNLAGSHLDRHDWVGSVMSAVESAAVQPTSVDLELTETTAPRDLAASAVAMSRARDLGFRLWLDDFGSGWSALPQLVDLPLDGIKLDRSIAAQLGDPVVDGYVEALCAAAAGLDVAVTIEGIETADAQRRASELGCAFAQGFLWSAPVPSEEVEGVLDSVGHAAVSAPERPGPARD